MLDDEKIEEEYNENSNGSGPKHNNSRGVSSLVNGGLSSDGQKLRNTIDTNKAKNRSNPNSGKKDDGSSDEKSADGKNKKNGDSVADDAAKEAVEQILKNIEKAGLKGKLAAAALRKSGIADKSAEQVSKLAKEFMAQKKKVIIVNFILPALPYILGALVAILVVVAVIGQIMVMRDKIADALVGVMETSQRMFNFVTGQGWNTEDEAFFDSLSLAYQQYQNGSEIEGDDELDIGLIAATVHYTTLTDLDVWDGEDGEKESEIGEGEGNYSAESGASSVLAETYQTWSFYEVANAKLGSWRSYFPGSRGLLGHLVRREITFRSVPLTHALSYWGDFLVELFDIPDFEDYQAAFGESPDAILNFISDLLDISDLSSMLLPTNIEDTLNKITAFAIQEQSYPEWWMNNIAYELRELAQFIMGTADDSYLKENPNSYYSHLEGKDASDESLVERIKTAWNSFGEEDNSAATEEEKALINVLVPVIKKYTDHKQYYRYLVDIYIPLTHFHGKTLGVDYTSADLVTMANEIFDQKDTYDYLTADIDNNFMSGCSYVYSSSGETTSVSITQEMLDNLYVNVLSSSCTSANCSDIAETVSFRDYIIGVAYRELEATLSSNEEYLKANIVAEKSFALGVRDIIEDNGRYYLTMQNSVNDQVYCSLTNGCMNEDSNRKPAPSSELIEFLGKLYDETANVFLYNTNTGRFTGYYRAYEKQCVGAGLTGSCLAQVESEKLALAGQDYLSILGGFYSDPIVILDDLSVGDIKVATKICGGSGLRLGEDGYFIRESAPISSDKYFNPPYTSNTNIGQCVWYVKGRAQEIIANSTASESLKDQAIGYIMNTYGDGNEWFKLSDHFVSSTDYTKPKAGSIAVYDWTDAQCLSYWQARGTNYCKEKYGHSLIVEAVKGNQVTITEGWTNCGTGSPTWDCVRFSNHVENIEYMKNNGGGYIFIGYVYLLD